MGVSEERRVPDWTKTLTQPKTQIEEVIANIPENTLRRAMQHLEKRLVCVLQNGQYKLPKQIC